MSEILSASDNELNKRGSLSDPKFGGLQVHGVDTGTVKRMTQARKDVLKVAIRGPNLDPQLYEINQKQSLQDNICDFCERWNISNPYDYALWHDDTHQYISEATRNEVRDGAVLCLTTSPSIVAQNIVYSLKQQEYPEKVQQALKDLVNYSADATFSTEFIQNRGLGLVVSTIEHESKGEKLAYALTAFLELMDHGIVSWDAVLTSKFVKVVAGCVNETKRIDATILQRALGIIECCIVNSHRYYSEIVDAMTVQSLVAHLQRSNPEIQQNTIALLNSLFLRTPVEKGRIVGRRSISNTMSQMQFRTVILNNVIRTSKTIGAEMAHQLYVLQVLTLNTLEERLKEKLDPESQEDRDKLFELRNIPFDSSPYPSQGSKHPQVHGAFNSMDFKKLGFSNYNNPVLDFDKVPPGVLALDLMYYFARNHQDNYIKLVLENSSRGDKHECPFGKSSIEVTKTLCEILKIGEQPTELGQDYYPMFFTHDHAFEEFFCICIQLFNKTWKEMSAIKDDFDKVVSVFYDQVYIALGDKSSSFDSFKHKLNSLPYSAILKRRQQEREDKENFDARATPVVELQLEIEPEMIELIKQQRYAYMKEGSVFHKISNKRRDKSRWFCRLSPNHKLFCYGDIEESDDSASIEFLPGQLPVATIKDLIVGKNCPHIRNARAHKSTTDLAFSILSDPDDHLNFVAPSREVWSVWTDGINALLGKEMTSSKAKADLDDLLSMEMKLRLLDLENIPIPDQPPEIPPLPKNYEFILSTS